MAWELDICGDEAISMPENEKCDECAEFAERLAETQTELADLQDLLKNYTEYEAGTHVVFTEIEPGLVRINAHVEGGGGGKDYIAGPGIQIDDLDEISADVREHEIARTEKSIAEEPHEVGEYFILNNRLYKVTAAIAVDDEIVEGTNVEETNVGDELYRNSQIEVIPIQTIGGKASGASAWGYITRIGRSASLFMRGSPADRSNPFSLGGYSTGGGTYVLGDVPKSFLPDTEYSPYGYGTGAVRNTVGSGTAYFGVHVALAANGEDQLTVNFGSISYAGGHAFGQMSVTAGPWVCKGENA